MEGELLRTFSLRKKCMKNLATNQSYIVLSRMKEVWEGVLSMFDGNQYTTSNNETEILPEELRNSLQNLEVQEKQYEANGMLINSIKQKNVTRVKTEKTKVRKLPEQQVQKVENVTKKTIKHIDNELGDDR